MSDRGHGRYGLRSGLRPFGEYEIESARRKDVFIRMHSAQILNSVWFNAGSGVYGHTWDETFNGRTLDVVGVRLIDEVLTRVDTGAELIATESSFRYFRDPGGILQLGVHLAGGASPSSRNVLIVSAWHNATGAAHRSHLVHPTISPRERLLNADLDLWSGSPEQPDDWTFESTVGVGASIVEKADGIGDGTLYAAKIHGNGGAVIGRIRQSVDLAVTTPGSPLDVGPWGYRLWTSYLTPRTILSTQGARIKITDRGSPEQQMAEDGRAVDGPAVDGLELSKTRGRMRLLCFDFIGFATPLSIELLGYSTTANTFDVYFGRTSLRKILGWDWYEPNVAPGGVPEIYEGSSDPFPGSESTGAGAVTLLNDGRALMETRFSYPWLWPAQDVEIMLGGAFEGGQELLLFDMHRAFKGIINGDNSPRVGPRRATVTVESYRQIFEASLPARFYGVDWPDIADADRNRPRPVVFGYKPHTRPAAIGFDPSSPTTGYRVYELADTTDWPTGIAGAGQNVGGEVYAYPDEEAADKQDAARRVILIDGRDFSQSITAGTLTIVHDVRVIEITAENQKFDFDVGGGIQTATITPGPYVIGKGDGTAGDRGLLEEVAAQVSSVGGVAITGVYDDVTHLVTLARQSKGTFDLYFSTAGPSAGASIAGVLGFEAQDHTGSVSYEGTVPLFESADSSHIIRADMGGYIDDAAGTWTGTPTTQPMIRILADVFRFVLSIFLKQPSDRVLADEWDAARASCPQLLGIYFGGLGDQQSTLKLSDFVDCLENGSPTAGEGPAEIRLDGEGRFRFLKRTSDVADDIPHIREHDLVELIDGGYMPSQCYGYVEVRHSRAADTGRPAIVRGEIEASRLAFQNERAAIFETFLTDAADAADAASAMSALARLPIRHFTLVVKSKVLRSLKGDLIRLTVSQALMGSSDVPGPGLDGAVFRIESKKLHPETQRVTLVVYTNIIT